MKAKINQLVEILKVYKTQPASEEIFKKSRMINEFNKLDFGFFPFGDGIFSEQYDDNCKVMVLGNDFGTHKYVKDCIKKGKKESETASPTIRNLLNPKSIALQLNRQNTFFTNFHLGCRELGTTMTGKMERQKDYKDLCYCFFKQQLSIMNPQIVLCLGKDVGNTLLEYNELLQKNWGSTSKKLKTFKELYEKDKFWVDDVDNLRRFIIAPHPCDTRNFTDSYKGKINDKLNIEKVS